MRRALTIAGAVIAFALLLAGGPGAKTGAVCYQVGIDGGAQAAPSGVPWPAAADGLHSTLQSDGGYSIPGAIRMLGGQGYHVALYAGGTATLLDAGTVDIYFCPENYNLPDGGSPCTGTWPRDPQLDETVSVGGTSCAGAGCPGQQFADHASPGTLSGWLVAVPDKTAESAGLNGAICIDLVYGH